MRKLQVPLTIAALLLVVLGMNTVADMRQQQAKARAKEVEKVRQQAEMAAAAAKGDASGHSGQGAESVAFKLPASSGPANAPVKVEIFVNNANSCHQASVALKEIQSVYGDLVRVEWLSMTDPKVTDRSDRLNIGCEAGLVINGNGGKALVSFRGPVGDKYKLSDVYRAVNQALQKKGKRPPTAAVAKSQL